MLLNWFRRLWETTSRQCGRKPSAWPRGDGPFDNKSATILPCCGTLFPSQLSGDSRGRSIPLQLLDPSVARFFLSLWFFLTNVDQTVSALKKLCQCGEVCLIVHCSCKWAAVVIVVRLYRVTSQDLTLIVCNRKFMFRTFHFLYDCIFCCSTIEYWKSVP